MIRALGVDAGTSRVGLAASDPSGVVATPVGTVSRRPSAAFWDRLLREVAAREIDRIVVGLPRHLDGSEGEAAAAARALAQEVGRRTGLEVEMWDERLTTVQAERALLGERRRSGARAGRVDDAAATLMLQNWLDARQRRPSRS